MKRSPSRPAPPRGESPELCPHLAPLHRPATPLTHPSPPRRGRGCPKGGRGAGRNVSGSTFAAWMRRLFYSCLAFGLGIHWFLCSNADEAVYVICSCL